MAVALAAVAGMAIAQQGQPRRGGGHDQRQEVVIDYLPALKAGRSTRS
jgi:hypothetical protein